MELTPLSCVLFWLHDAVLCLQLWRVALGRPALALSFVLWFEGTFPLLRIRRSKVSLLLFKLLLDLDSISVCHVERGDVQEFYFFLDVLVQEATVFEYQMLLRILDTQLCAKGMKNIGKLQNVLFPSLSQRAPLYVLILITSDRVVLLLDGNRNEFQVGAAEKSEVVLSSFYSH